MIYTVNDNKKWNIFHHFSLNNKRTYNIHGEFLRKREQCNYYRLLDFFTGGKRGHSENLVAIKMPRPNNF